MISEKIQSLIEELAEECKKENVALSLATLSATGKITLAQEGNISLIALAVLEQYDQEKQELLESDCTCYGHRTLKRMFGIDTEETSNNTHTFVTDDPNEVFDILSNILRGEFK